jgi:cell division protein FtsI (penicillin-binding protein 3)
VTAAGGTAPDAEVPGYSVGGKTGTAYKHGPHGYDHSHYRASFVGIAPISTPRIVVAVSIDDPTGGSHFGGQVAGPAFSSIAGDTLRALNVAPDLPIKAMAVNTTATQDGPVPADTSMNKTPPATHAVKTRSAPVPAGLHKQKVAFNAMTATLAQVTR